LARDGRTVEEVAFSLGYATATSLARAMKSQTGLTPKEASEAGGMDRVREALFPEGIAKAKPRAAGASNLGKIASLALTALLSACATLGLAGPRVDPAAIDRLLDAPPVDRVHFGVIAVDAESGRVLYERDADQWFVPASNQKIPITAAAWSLLGPDYRFRTELWRTGATIGGVVEGDLVLVGSGDPSLSRRYWDSGPAALLALADSTAATGIRRVTGALVIDSSAWDSTTVLPTREVADLVFADGATGGAFAIDEGEVVVVARGGDRPGGPAELEWSPRGRDGFVLSRVRTTTPDSVSPIRASYLPETRRLVLDGAVAPGSLDTLVFAQRDPVRVASAELLRGLVAAGITVDRGWTVRWTDAEPFAAGCVAPSIVECAGAHRVAGLVSPPLSELVRVVLEPSSNWVAEQLTFTLGAELGGEGSLEEGLDVVARFLVDEVGLDPSEVLARDASGLSAYNLLTPRAIARILLHMAARTDAAAYRAALVQPGEENSTMEERLLDLASRLSAKTGTISNVNSLSGYLVREDGQEVIFSILANGAGLDDETMKSTIDEVVRTLARR
jgi:D-alanyl-D-alanine carboxypeptidase/D-alanyl-D-alanine-endopeptidase (penicillin-binding protein 4)